MKNFTQKALLVVLTVFVMVGLFYGTTTPVKAVPAAAASLNPAVPQPHEVPGPVCEPDPSPCIPQ